MLYTVQDTTMTALGDAVRNKKFINTGQEDFSVDLGFDNDSITITSINNAPLYKYELINGDVEGSTVVSYHFWIKDKDSNYIYQNSSFGTDDFPITFITSSNSIDIHFSTNYPSMHCRFDVVLTPLDENSNNYKYTPAEMVDEINNLITIPDEALTITGECAYKFGYGGWDWLIEKYGDKITTKDISNTQYMFYLSRLTDIPFEINLKNNTTIGSSMFGGCYYLKKVPKVNLIITTPKEMDQIFQGCNSIREIPEWFVDYLEQSYVAGKNNSFFGPFDSLFSNCYSLRKIPDRAMKHIAINGNISGKYYTVAYSRPFAYCVCLDELKGISCDNYAFTSNEFNNFFEKLSRVKDITFETNEDSTPLIRSWKNQTIPLTNDIGFLSSTYISQVVSYNSGITADKEVKDDATYQALKNDPDWWSRDINYSRYNHDSAVNTINSLPDCSSSGGTNTIKFKGAAGALTDGGAINTLTEEEIAVATAKSWTVSLV